MSMYMQMAQRQQANETFNRGAGLLAASMYPGRRPDLIMNAMTGATQDPNAIMRTMMGLSDFQRQQSQYQQLQAAAPALAQQMNVPLATAQAIIASGKYGDVESALAGVGGDPTVREMTQARLAWVQAHSVRDASGNVVRDAATGQPQTDQPIPPTLLSVDQYKNNQLIQQQKGKDLIADQANFPQAKNAYDQMIADAQDLIDPKKTPGLDNIVGSWANQNKSVGMPDLDPTTQTALAKYNKIMGAQYAAGVQDFHGAGRISQQELKQDLPSQSTMSNRAQQGSDFRIGTEQYIKKLQLKRAQLFGQAGQLNSPDLSDDDYNNLVNPIYKPHGDLYAPGQAPRAPAASAPASAAPPAAQTGADFSKMSDADANAAYDKLPSGTVFVGPDGKPHRKP
jgi:hypothetical protein